MTEAERAAWDAFEAGIMEAGLIDSAEDVARLNRWYAEMEEERVRRYSMRAVRAAMKTQQTPGTPPHSWPWTPREGE